MVHCRNRCLPQRRNLFSSGKVLKCYSKSSCSETGLPNGSFFVLPVWLLRLWVPREFAVLWRSLWPLFLVKAGLWWRLPGEESGILLSGKGLLWIGNSWIGTHALNNTSLCTTGCPFSNFWGSSWGWRMITSYTKVLEKFSAFSIK